MIIPRKATPPAETHASTPEEVMAIMELLASAVRQYTESVRRDRLVRRDVAVVMNGLRQSLELERKRVPGEILYEADRLESLFFAGYDPHFEGDEPPGL